MRMVVAAHGGIGGFLVGGVQNYVRCSTHTHTDACIYCWLSYIKGVECDQDKNLHQYHHHAIIIITTTTTIQK